MDTDEQSLREAAVMSKCPDVFTTSTTSSTDVMRSALYFEIKVSETKFDHCQTL